jgi:hypothetical protein
MSTAPQTLRNQTSEGRPAIGRTGSAAPVPHSEWIGNPGTVVYWEIYQSDMVLHTAWPVLQLATSVVQPDLRVGTSGECPPESGLAATDGSAEPSVFGSQRTVPLGSKAQRNQPISYNGRQHRPNRKLFPLAEAPEFLPMSNASDLNLEDSGVCIEL